MELHLLIGDFKLSLVANKFERIEPVEYSDTQPQSVGFQPRTKEIAHGEVSESPTEKAT